MENDLQLKNLFQSKKAFVRPKENDFFQLKITFVRTEENNYELHFDYYNKENKLIGTVMVDILGRLFWQIFNVSVECDDNYEVIGEKIVRLDCGIENIILDLVSDIYGTRVKNNKEFINFARLPIGDRWEKAQQIIEDHGYYINNKGNDYYNEDYYDRAMAKRRKY